MTVEELNTELYERMFEEQERFRSELLGKSPQEVLDHAYEYVMREDLLLSQEEQEAVFYMRRALSSMKTEEAAENILSMFLHTRNNAELVARIRRQKYV